MNISKQSGVSCDSFYRLISETDQNVSLQGVCNFSSTLSQSIGEVIDWSIKQFGVDTSIFLSGSLAFALRAGYFQEFQTSGTDRSDIDIWIIIPDDLFLIDSGDSRANNALRELEESNMTSLPWPQSIFSIKVIRRASVLSTLSFDQNVLTVLRHKSLLTIKKVNTFSGLNCDYKIGIQEHPLRNKFLWHWSAAYKNDDDFYLNDLHGFIIMGNFLRCDSQINELRHKFISEWLSQLRISKGYMVSNDMSPLLSYHCLKTPHTYVSFIEKQANHG